MVITQATVEARLAELKASLAKLHADANATSGAIQDCEHWLAVLVAPVTEEKTDGSSGDGHLDG